MDGSPGLVIDNHNCVAMIHLLAAGWQPSAVPGKNRVGEGVGGFPRGGAPRPPLGPPLQNLVGGGGGAARDREQELWSSGVG